jgi:mono/diheme cytochrome c family protein
MRKSYGVGASIALLLGVASARAEELPRDSGSAVFTTYCASCHGVSGKGDGPLADSLRYRPPDLTRIAQRNKGSFPKVDVQRIIDGRKPVKGHGGTDMPVWGDAFKSSRSGYSEDAVKIRIDDLALYLESIQAKDSK